MKTEKEKIIEIKKEVLNIIESKKKKFMSNNIEIEIVTDLELKYYAIFWKKENIAYIVIGNPNFAPYKNICFEIMEAESKK